MKSSSEHRNLFGITWTTRYPPSIFRGDGTDISLEKTLTTGKTLENTLNVTREHHQPSSALHFLGPFIPEWSLQEFHNSGCHKDGCSARFTLVKATFGSRGSFGHLDILLFWNGSSDLHTASGRTSHGLSSSSWRNWRGSASPPHPTGPVPASPSRSCKITPRGAAEPTGPVRIRCFFVGADPRNGWLWHLNPLDVSRWI